MTGRTRRWSFVLAAMAGFSLGLGRGQGGRWPDAPPRREYARPAAAPDAFADRDPLPAGQAGALVSQVGARDACAVRADPGRGGLRIETPDGKPVPWHRDETDVYRVVCEVPAGVESVRVRLDVICNEPAVDAAGYLTYGNGSVAIINWATCLMYPEGPSADETRVKAVLGLPSSWDVACALKTEGGFDGTAGGQPLGKSVHFPEVSLTELVDNPLIAGEHLRQIPLDVGQESARVPGPRLGIPERPRRSARTSWRSTAGSCGKPGRCSAPAITRRSTSWSRAATTWAIWGWSTWRAASTACASATCSRRIGCAAGWATCCHTNTSTPGAASSAGRPGCARPTSRRPQKTRLLWVYEGLAEYLGEVLMVRSGMIERGGLPPHAHLDDRFAVASRRPALAVARGHGRRLATAPRRQPQLERAEARAGLLLRGCPDLARGRRDHPREVEGEAQPRRLLPQVPGHGTDVREGRPLRAGRRREGPERRLRIRLGALPQAADRAAAGRAAAGSRRPVRLSRRVHERAPPVPPAGSRGAVAAASRPGIRSD